MILIKRNNRTESGATFIEFLISALLFFFILGGFFTFGVILYRYALSVQSITEAMRRVSVDTQANSCVGNPTSPLETYIEQEVEMRLSEFGVPGSVTRSRVKKSGSDCTMDIDVGFEVGCFFCSLFGINSTIHVQGESGFEDPLFIMNCPGGCGDCPTT